jgi:hypothetical protein
MKWQSWCAFRLTDGPLFGDMYSRFGARSGRSQISGPVQFNLIDWDGIREITAQLGDLVCVDYRARERAGGLPEFGIASSSDGFNLLNGIGWAFSVYEA